MERCRILLATYPFGQTGRKPLEILEAAGHEVVMNPYGRHLRAGEVEDLIKDADAVIAGTETYSPAAISSARRLKVIARVGIGLDNVDVAACRAKGIMVTYTPDAPTEAVAELTVANIINLSRHILASDCSVRAGAWNRLMGKLLRELVVGVVGVGRIGKRVCQLLRPFKTTLLAREIKPDEAFGKEHGLTWVDKETMFRQADIVTLHIPGSRSNHNYVDRPTLALMKTGSCLVNTSRGTVVDQPALTDALAQKHLGGAALDVFEKEPYVGPFAKMDNVILTAHIGASAAHSRFLMELGAAEDCIRVLNRKVPANPAPLEE